MWKIIGNIKKHYLKYLFLFLLLFLSRGILRAETICQRPGSETWGSLQISEFKVEGKLPVRKGDKVDFSFNLKNVGSSGVKLGKKGAYLKTSDGNYYSVYSGETISPGKSLFVNSSFSPQTVGRLTVKPGVCVSVEKEELCHDFDISCAFDVFANCPEGAVCQTEDAASKGSYVKISNEICGYQISGGPNAQVQIPMYCYFQVQQCPSNCLCVSQAEAQKNQLIPCGQSNQLILCDYKNGEKMYCFGFPPQTETQEKPDLTVSDVWGIEPTPGTYSEIRATVGNIGRARAPSSILAFFINGNFVGQVEVKELSPGEVTVATFKISRQCNLPDQIVMEARADYPERIEESNENNNVLKKTYQCQGTGEMADLVLDILWHQGEENFVCRTRQYTQDKGIAFRVVNKGSATSTSVQAELLIDGRFVGTLDIPSLGPRQEYIGNFSLNLTCSGSEDEIQIRIDPQNRLPEINENNNNLTKRLNCFVQPTGKPDLLVQRIWLEPSGTAQWKINYEIKNDGGGFACGSHTGLYVDGRLAAEDYVDVLAPGQSLEKSFSWQYSMEDCTLPQDTIEVKANWKNEIEEISTTNNVYFTIWPCTQISTTTSTKPDLVVLQGWYTEAPGQQDNVTVKCRIHNYGGSPASDFIVALRIDYQDFDTERISQLGPGESVDVTFDRIWHPRHSSSLPSEHIIEFVVDSTNAIDEIPNEENNIATTTWDFPMSCDDGIKNRDEVDVDCGGRYCPRCGFVEIRGKIVYEDLTENRTTRWLPSRFTKFKIEGDLNFGPMATDDQGNFSVPIEQIHAGKKIKLRIDMWDVNYAARIAKDLDYCNEYVWFESKNDITIPQRGILNLGELRVGKDTNYEFVGYWKEEKFSVFCGSSPHLIEGGSVYLNIADAILTARMYADANRDDNDGIGRVDVQYPDEDWSNYSSFWEEITLTKDSETDHGWEDGSVAHEYGHFLQNKISEENVYVSSPSHKFCTDKDNTEFAFSEGFAEYFGNFMVAKNSHLSFPDISYKDIETPGCSHIGADMEAGVAAVLWDMVDDNNFPDSQSEPFDEVSGLDSIIFKMLDSELDHWYDAPDVCEILDKIDRRVDPATFSKVSQIFANYHACY